MPRLFDLVALAVVTVGALGCADTSSGDSLTEQQQEQGWGPDHCPATPPGVNVGYAVGEQLGELVLFDCAGEVVDIRELCGADALWMSLAHMWCPHCVKGGSDMERIHQSYKDAGFNLASVNIVVEDTGGELPDASDCSAWRDQHGQDRVLTLYDDDNDALVLWDENLTSLNVILTADRVIVSKLHTDIEADIRAAIDFGLP